MTARAFVVCVLLAAGCGAARAGAAPPDRSWRDGPVRYLLSASEYERFGRLATDASREAFVERFWYRLDPDPSTQANEFRNRFESRCGEVEDRFSDFHGPGWRSDRGRVYLALGEPDTVERLPGDPNSIGRDVWTYFTASTGSPLRLVFYRGTDGVLRLDPGAGVKPDLFDPEVRRVLIERFRDANPSLGRIRSASIVNGYLIGVLVPNAEDRRAFDRFRIEEARRAEPSPPRAEAPPGRLHEEVYYFQAADGSVVALLTLEVVVGTRPPVEGDVPPYHAVAYVSATADLATGGAQRTVPLAPFSSVDASERERFVGRVYLEPGTSQRVRYAVTDSSRNTLLLRTATLHAPELGTGRLSTSSLVPAERYGPAPEDGSAFAVGSEEVVPRPSAAYRRGEPLRLYLQVYDASIHAHTRRYDVNLAFEFYRLGNRGWKRHGKRLHVRGAYGASLGLALPIGDWPTGEYRAEVVVEDKLTGLRTEAGASFSVTD